MPTSSASGPETQGQPMAGQCGEKKAWTPSWTENWFIIRVCRALFLFRMQGRGSGSWRKAPAPWPGPSKRASFWKSRLKLPAAAPRPELPKGWLPSCNWRTREEVVGEVSRKTPSFHGGDGGGSLMSSTTIPEQILFIELSLTKGNRGLRFFPHLLIFSLLLPKQIHVK